MGVQDFVLALGYTSNTSFEEISSWEALLDDGRDEEIVNQNAVDINIGPIERDALGADHGDHSS
eukprot:scaffold10413_cov130-Cylindrotheca_fusiformis.AAC.2